MLLNISVKYLWKYSTLNMKNRKQEVLIQSGNTKNGIHMTFKVIKVECNENWSTGDQV